MTGGGVRLPWGSHRRLTHTELIAYPLIAGWVLFVFWSAWASQSESDDATGYVLIRIIGGTASTFVAFAAAWVLFVVQRRLITQRRILDDIPARAPHRTERSDSDEVVHQLAAQLSSARGPTHLVVRMVDGPARHDLVEALSVALAARDILPTWVRAAESERAFHDGAQASFLVLAERAGERGDNLGRLWSIVWSQGKAVVIGTDLDADVVPGEATGIRRVADRLAALSALPVPTVAFIADGCAPADIEVAAEIRPPRDDDGPALDPFPLHAQRAFAFVGRFLHLRNAGSWTWSDIPAQVEDGQIVVGMAWLAANGQVLPSGDGGLRFATNALLARARGHGAGMDASAHWPAVLALPRSPVILTSLQTASALAARSVEDDPSPVDALAQRAEFVDELRSDLPILTAVFAGLAEGGVDIERLSHAVVDPPNAWRPPKAPQDRARLDALRRLRIPASDRLLQWAWIELRDAALPPSYLTYPVRRELVSQLALDPDRTVPAVLPLWHDDITALPLAAERATAADALRAPGADASPADTQRWESTIGMACHLAWALPAIYATAPAPLRAELDPLLDRLHRISIATAAAAPTDANASIDFLQAWGEGLYYGSLRGGSPYTGVDDDRPPCSQPWPYRLALVMTVAAARGTPEVAQPDDHPIVLAMISELARVSALDPSPDGVHPRHRVLWGEEFEALRTAAPGITAQARWILAAKAILFSAAEARRGPKPHWQRGVEDRRQLMLGIDLLPSWLEDVTSPSPDGVTIDQIRAQPNRRVTRTFAGLVLAGPRPELSGGGSARRAQTRFWSFIEEVLERIANG